MLESYLSKTYSEIHMPFRFATPWAFLLLLPLAFAAWRLLRRPKRPRAVPFAPVAFIPSGGFSLRATLARATPFVIVAALALLVIAAARPQTFLSRERRSANAIAIAMAVDVSGSMMALDLAGDPNADDAPTRLDVVKDEFASFISRRPDDLVTLVTFGGYASTRSPLTADHRALLQYLKAVSVPGLDEDEGPVAADEAMTAVGDGLVTACARLQECDLATKIVVLLSDGVSNAGVVQPAKAAAIAAELGIKVYAIGVGSRNGVAPFRTVRFGRPAVVAGRVEFDEAELKGIASTTGGRYYSVSDRSELDDIMREIDALEKTRVESDVFNNYTERFVTPLLAGAFLLALAVAMNLFAVRRPI